MVSPGSQALKQVNLTVRDGLRAGLNDPLSRGGLMVVTSYPQRPVRYPVVTVRTESVGLNYYGLQNSDGFQSFITYVVIYSNSLKEADILADEVITIVGTARFNVSTQALQIFDIGIVGVSDSFKDEDGKRRVYIKTIEVRNKTTREVTR